MGERPNLDVPLFSKRMLEGEYANWALVWSRNYGAGVDMIEVAVDNFGTVHSEDIATNIAYQKEFDGTEIITANYLYMIWDRINSMSVTGKYCLGVETVNWLILDVWRDGVVIWSRDVSLDELNTNTIYSATISPNGKFIAVIITDNATFDERIVMLYEGA